MSKLEKNKGSCTLKVDIDIKTKKEAIKLLGERISYLHDLNIFLFTEYHRIILVKKRTYGCKCVMNHLYTDEFIVLLQLMLGSDYRKEANSLYNRFILKMDYWNRMFDVKVYRDGKIRKGKLVDITDEIRKIVFSKRRRKNYF